MAKHPVISNLAIITTGLLLFVANPASADIKAATVNVDTLIIEYHLAKKEISSLKANRDEYIKKRETRQKKLSEITQKLRTIFTKLKSKAMPKTERANLNEQKDELSNQYNALAKDLKESDQYEVNETKRKLAIATRRLLDEFHIVIQQYAKDHGYQWIIDSSGTSNSHISPLLYAREAKDVTEEILAILNKDAPPEKAPQEKDASQEKATNGTDKPAE